MFAGKTLAQALEIALSSAKHAQSFVLYATTAKAHKVRWVRAAQALEKKDMLRVRAYMAQGEEKREAWEAVKAKEAPAQAKAPAKPAPAPKAKAPAKAKPEAKPAQGQLSDADVLRIAQLVASMLTGKKVA